MSTYTTDVLTIIQSLPFQAAVNELRDQHDRFVEDIIKLTELPAPPFGEENRARAYEAMFRGLGLQDVARDAIGNVTGVRPGRDSGRIVVVAAHLDTVFPEGTDCTVRREGTRLYAPGVGDDTRGLAALLAFARALDAGRIETNQDLLFVGDVGEEGTGDLRGVRHLLTEGRYRDRVAAFFTIDGLETDSVTTTAVGSYRYRLTFRGPGGHSLLDFGTVNPAHAMSAVVMGLSQTAVPTTPRTTHCAAVFGGGSSVNAIPEEVWVEVDLRSEDQNELDLLNTHVHKLVDDAVAEENRRGNTAAGAVTAKALQIGNRPAGRTDGSARIIQAALDAMTAYGFEPRTDASSTDANIPMSLGIPAIRIGSGGSGGRLHSLDEWIDVEPEASVRGLSTALAAILGTTGFRLAQLDHGSSSSVELP